MNIGTIIRDAATQIFGGMLTGVVVDMLPLSYSNSVDKSNAIKAAAELLVGGAVGGFIGYSWMDMMRTRGWYSGADTANLLLFYTSASATMPRYKAATKGFSDGLVNLINTSYFTEGMMPTKIPNQDNTSTIAMDTSYVHGYPDNNPATNNVGEEDQFPINLNA